MIATAREDEDAVVMKGGVPKPYFTKVRCVWTVTGCTINTDSIKIIMAPYWSGVGPSLSHLDCLISRNHLARSEF